MKRTKQVKRVSPHKGRNITSDYIPYQTAMIEGNKLLWSDRPVIGFYIIFAINTGLRISDILNINHTDLHGKRAGDVLEVKEGKTKKLRKIRLNEKIIVAYIDLKQALIKSGKYEPFSYIFTSNKGNVYRIPTINTHLKQTFAGHAQNISSHSLRKSFGRHVYDTNQQSEHALMLLSDIFQHSSMSITRKYLGLRDQEIGNVYLNL